MRGYLRFLSSLMIATVLMVSIGATHSFAHTFAHAASPHSAEAPCPCPDNADCGNKTCDNLSVCISNCFHAIAVEIGGLPQLGTFALMAVPAPQPALSSISRPPPLPPPTI